MTLLINSFDFIIALGFKYFLIIEILVVNYYQDFSNMIRQVDGGIFICIKSLVVRLILIAHF